MEKENKIEDVVETNSETQNEVETLSVQQEETDVETVEAEVAEEVQAVQEEKTEIIEEVKPKKKKSKKGLLIALIVVLVLGVGGYFAYVEYIQPPKLYAQALELYEDKNYQEAVEILELLDDDYEDVSYLKEDSYYYIVFSIADSGDYDAALELANETLSEYIYNIIKSSFNYELMFADTISIIKDGWSETSNGTSTDFTIDELISFTDASFTPMVILRFTITLFGSQHELTKLLLYSSTYGEILIADYDDNEGAKTIIDSFLSGSNSYVSYGELYSVERILANVE